MCIILFTIISITSYNSPLLPCINGAKYTISTALLYNTFKYENIFPLCKFIFKLLKHIIDLFDIFDFSVLYK